jgi:hypothetical protein
MIDYFGFTSWEFFIQPFLIAGLLFSVFLIALSWMASELFLNPSLKAFAKNELRELGVTAIIVLIALILIAPGSVFDIVSSGFSSASSSSVPERFLCKNWVQQNGPVTHNGYIWKAEKSNIAFGYAQYFLGCETNIENTISFIIRATGLRDICELIGGCDPNAPPINGVMFPELVKQYLLLMIIELLSGVLSTLGLSLQIERLMIFEVDIHFTLFSFLTPLNEINTFLINTLSTIIASVTAQMMLLKFIEINIPTVILPLGIIMRSFPFTRKTGSSLIALSFVAYFVYPTSILINQRLYEQIINPPCKQGQLPEGSACNFDFQCCSNYCEEGECTSPFGSFEKYKSTLQLCSAIKNEEEFKRKLTEYNQKLEELRNQESLSPGTQTQKRLEEKQATKKQLNDKREEFKNIETNLNITPKQGWSLYHIYESIIFGTAKLIVINLIFIVLEIVIVLTLYKDISLLIGGEAKIVGISKLV